MKALLLAILVSGVLVGFAVITPKTTTVVNDMEVSTSTPQVVEVDALDKEIEKAQDNARAEIEAKAQSAYDDAYNQEMKKVELEVIRAFNEKLEQRQIELEKETKVY